VTSKNISLTDDAYKLLKKMKMGDESFSDTIRRLAKRRRLSDCAGLWADVPNEEMAALSENILELRKRTRKSLEAGVLEGS
jgi:predicted CopG family antitoxin